MHYLSLEVEIWLNSWRAGRSWQVPVFLCSNLQEVPRKRSVWRNFHFKLKSRHHYEQQIWASPAIHRTTVTREVRHGSWESWAHLFKTNFIFVLSQYEYNCLTREKSKRSCIKQIFCYVFVLNFKIQLVCLRKMSRSEISLNNYSISPGGSCFCRS